MKYLNFKIHKFSTPSIWWKDITNGLTSNRWITHRKNSTSHRIDKDIDCVPWLLKNVCLPLQSGRWFNPIWDHSAQYIPGHSTLWYYDATGMYSQLVIFLWKWTRSVRQWNQISAHTITLLHRRQLQHWRSYTANRSPVLQTRLRSSISRRQNINLSENTELVHR